MCYNNGCFGGFGGGSYIWIILIIVLLFSCGGNGFGCASGCERPCC